MLLPICLCEAVCASMQPCVGPAWLVAIFMNILAQQCTCTPDAVSGGLAWHPVAEKSCGEQLQQFGFCLSSIAVVNSDWS